MKEAEAIEWLKREPMRFTNDRANVGSAIHAAAEAWVLRVPMKGEFVEEERQAIGHFIDWVQTLGVKFVATEASVYNRTQRYAGTLDAIVEIPYARLLERVDGNPNRVPWTPREGNDVVRILVDYKSGGDVEEGKGVYPEMGLQLAAYAHAEFQGAPNGAEVPLPELDGTAVLQVQAKGWRFVPIDGLDPKVYKAFLYVREVFRFREEISKEIMGEAIVPPPREIPADRAPAPKATAHATVDEDGTVEQTAPLETAPGARKLADVSDEERARIGLPPKPTGSRSRRRPAP